MKILFQGDSITDCHRQPYSEESFQDLAQGSLGGGYALLASARLLAKFPEKQWKCINRGVGGNRVVDLYARWSIDCLREPLKIPIPR